MVKKIVIAGCRNYNNYKQAKAFLDSYLNNIKKEHEIIIISGCSNGADRLGELYAEENGFRIEKHPADWKRYGRSAGPKRNEEMAKIADAVICFLDGKSRGTKSMIDFANKYKKPLKIKIIHP